MSTTITYNGTDIVVEDGQTCTLHCAETVFTSDISINAASQLAVNYDGQTIASLEEDQRLTLHCGGRKAKSDIAVVCSSEETPDEPTEYIITAGTYIFNDDPVVTINASLSFYNPLDTPIQGRYWDGSGATYRTSISDIHFYNASTSVRITYGNAVVTSAYTEYSKGDWGWRKSGNTGLFPSEIVRKSCTTMTVTSDFEVDRDFYRMFIANTIKE